MIHPIRRADVQAEIEAKSHLLSTATAGKLMVEFIMKDGAWVLGTINVVFPRRHVPREEPN